MVTSPRWKNRWKWFVFTNVKVLGTLRSLKLKQGFANFFYTTYYNSSLYSRFANDSFWQSDIDDIYVDNLIFLSFEVEKSEFLTMATVEAKLTIFLNPSSLDACGLEKLNN